MAKSNILIPAEYVVPINMNGLKGRMLKLPAPKGVKREALLVYGHHASLERFYSLAQVLNDYAGVTMPDLPGFGGMDSFYTIDEKADIDTMADYLASIIKLRYKKTQKFDLLAVSYGFTIVTRMLIRYPEIAKQVNVLASIVGFAHHEDLQFGPGRYNFYLGLARFFGGKYTAPVFGAVCLRPSILRKFYSRTHNAKIKFGDLNYDESILMTEFEIHLWRINEVRTYAETTKSMFMLNNCIGKVDLPVWHVYVKSDNYFNYERVQKHLEMIFNKVNPILAPVEHHMPNIIAGKTEVSALVPKELRDLLK